MKIANGVEMLEISANIMGKASFIHPTLIWDNTTVILVDTGFPGQLPKIKEAIEEAGVSFEKLNMVILTHQDIDHIGNVANIVKESCNNVKVFAHEEEAPYINGEKNPLKIAQLEANLESLPDEMKSMYEKMKAAFLSSRINIDKTLIDGEELPYCGGITVLFTPGHTTGHICLYHKQSKTLIAGDALRNVSGTLEAAQPSATYDLAMSNQSLKKLTAYDIHTVICYHGGKYTENVNQRIKELAAE